MTFLILIVAITAVVFLSLFLLRNRWTNTWKNRAHVVMAYPAFLILLLMAYIPMSGLILAFKNFNYSKGIFASPWVEPIYKNFTFLLASKGDFLTMTKNTFMYYFIFTILGTFLNIVLAIAIDQFLFKRMAKTMQTIMIIPVFVSYAAVQFIVFAFLSTDMGIINTTLGTNTKFYTTAPLWPYILTTVKIWNSVGYGSVLYMSVLAGIDTGLYEAAQIDGAGKSDMAHNSSRAGSHDHRYAAAFGWRYHEIRYRSVLSGNQGQRNPLFDHTGY